MFQNVWIIYQCDVFREPFDEVDSVASPTGRFIMNYDNGSWKGHEGMCVEARVYPHFVYSTVYMLIRSIAFY